MRKTLTLSAATLLALAAPVVAQEIQSPSRQTEQAQPVSPQQTQQPSQQTQQTPQKEAQGQSGLQTAVQATVQATYYTLQQADLRASDLIGMDVYNTNNDDIGEIKDLIIEDGKNLKAIVIDVGGFLGAGERTVAVTPGSLVIQKQGNDRQRAIINATKESLTSAPEFRRQAQAR
jgi:sporulation protein YlmC with PRC-barrel domain